MSANTAPLITLPYLSPITLMITLFSNAFPDFRSVVDHLDKHLFSPSDHFPVALFLPSSDHCLWSPLPTVLSDHSSPRITLITITSPSSSSFPLITCIFFHIPDHFDHSLSITPFNHSWIILSCFIFPSSITLFLPPITLITLYQNYLPDFWFSLWSLDHLLLWSIILSPISDQFDNLDRSLAFEHFDQLRPIWSLISDHPLTCPSFWRPWPVPGRSGSRPRSTPPPPSSSARPGPQKIKNHTTLT